ncbi:hypothetical protein AGR4A_Cc190316 [Agrobacterium tumefaciens str. B6]|uniref:Uncharacterized protein n=1 Tax=Agrobacterium tumefaciens str. B6 TaxID=1183423 RepID=A0A822UZ58_AGRTU|nr:hypothetical protein AGR4A_Cc190316 [Agrobacterium tumefaciens str. B6]
MRGRCPAGQRGVSRKRQGALLLSIPTNPRDYTSKILPVTYMLCNHVLAVPPNNRDWIHENAALRFHRHRIARLHRHSRQCRRSGALYQPAERGRAGDR